MGKILALFLCLLISIGTLSETAWGTESLKSLKSKSLNVIVEGDDEFQKKTYEALALIKEKAPDQYDVVKKYISIIRMAEKSGMRAYDDPPVYEVGSATSSASLSWYASTICHDAYHSKLYHDYFKKFRVKPPNSAWTGRGAENKCLAFQKKCLEKFSAPTDEIKHLQKMKYVDYFSSYEQRNW